jgi:hypothetical protein
MSKYHVNPKTGKPGICTAVKACRFGESTEHYATPEDARLGYEKSMTQEVPRISRKSAIETIQSSINRLTEEREALNDALSRAFVRVRTGMGVSSKLAMEREEYDRLMGELETTGQELQDKQKELRAFNPPPRYVPDFPQAFGLEDARLAYVKDLNNTGFNDEPFFTKNIEENLQESLDRYHAGEKLDDSSLMVRIGLC